MTRFLEGQVALVTGAGRGLGRAFAEHLAAAGAKVGVHGMREQGPSEYGEGTTLTDTAREIGEFGQVQTLKVLADLTDGEHVERIVSDVTQQLGPIDILVHNAGGDIAALGGKPDPNDAVMISPDDIKAVLDRNLLTTILVCRDVAGRMIQRNEQYSEDPSPGGRIITISSIAAFTGTAQGAIYATAKAGQVAYTRSLAQQLRPHNITVNSLAPGDTRTGRFMNTRDVDQQRMVTEGTLERIATVDEVARVVEFFAGPLGQFVSGQTIRVDGGHQAWSA